MRGWGCLLCSQRAPDDRPRGRLCPAVFSGDESLPWPMETPFITCPQATGVPPGDTGRVDRRRGPGETGADGGAVPGLTGGTSQGQKPLARRRGRC